MEEISHLAERCQRPCHLSRVSKMSGRRYRSVIVEFTCIGDTFLGLVEKGFLGVGGELLLGLIAEVFASRVEEKVSSVVQGAMKHR